MDLIIDETHLKCYDNGLIDRCNKISKKWKNVKGSDGNHGYLVIRINNKLYSIHRLIYKAFNYKWDLNSPLQIDHINRDKKDNRIENLRLVTNQQNSFNREAMGYIRQRNSFKGRIQVNGKMITKCFATEDEARNWYLEQKAILHVI